MDGSIDQIIKPDIQELPNDTAAFLDIAEFFSERNYFAFLDSRINTAGPGRFSYLACDPFLVIESKKGHLRHCWYDGSETLSDAGFFDSLDTMMDRFHIDPDCRASRISPFCGGAIGYFSYELGRQIERLPSTTVDLIGAAEARVAFYNLVVILEHQTGKIFVAHFNPGLACRYPSIDAFLAEIPLVSAGRYRQNLAGLPEDLENISLDGVVLESSMTREEYLRKVRQIKEYIRAGDVYQVNLTRCFSTAAGNICPWQLYKTLMAINPAPFAAYLNYGDTTVVSSSPERFLAIDGETIETRPIKGTVRRDSDPDKDQRLKNWLLNSEKNRAELTMIVDLLRNDIGRICEIGSVSVEDFPAIESYASLHHLVGTVRGRLREGTGISDIFRATFPGGSITGAPKIRAMEIIDELEPVERGIYTGSIGFLGFNRRSDLNIVIRTIILKDGRIYIQAGGGIVADSDPEEEYHESLLKADKLLKAVALLKSLVEGQP